MGGESIGHSDLKHFQEKVGPLLVPALGVVIFSAYPGVFVSLLLSHYRLGIIIDDPSLGAFIFSGTALLASHRALPFMRTFSDGAIFGGVFSMLITTILWAGNLVSFIPTLSVVLLILAFGVFVLAGLVDQLFTPEAQVLTTTDHWRFAIYIATVPAVLSVLFSLLHTFNPDFYEQTKTINSFLFWGGSIAISALVLLVPLFINLFTVKYLQRPAWAFKVLRSYDVARFVGLMAIIVGVGYFSRHLYLNGRHLFRLHDFYTLNLLEDFYAWYLPHFFGVWLLVWAVPLFAALGPVRVETRLRAFLILIGLAASVFTPLSLWPVRFTPGNLPSVGRPGSCEQTEFVKNFRIKLNNIPYINIRKVGTRSCISGFYPIYRAPFQVDFNVYFLERNDENLELVRGMIRDPGVHLLARWYLLRWLPPHEQRLIKAEFRNISDDALLRSLASHTLNRPNDDYLEEELSELEAKVKPPSPETSCKLAMVWWRRGNEQKAREYLNICDDAKGSNAAKAMIETTPLFQNGRVSGNISSEFWKPEEDKVFIYLRETGPSGRTIDKVRADPDGKFSFDQLVEGKYYLDVQALSTDLERWDKLDPNNDVEVLGNPGHIKLSNQQQLELEPIMIKKKEQQDL